MKKFKWVEKMRWDGWWDEMVDGWLWDGYCDDEMVEEEMRYCGRDDMVKWDAKRW